MNRRGESARRTFMTDGSVAMRQSVAASPCGVSLMPAIATPASTAAGGGAMPRGLCAAAPQVSTDATMRSRSALSFHRTSRTAPSRPAAVSGRSSNEWVPRAAPAACWLSAGCHTCPERSRRPELMPSVDVAAERERPWLARCRPP